MGEYSFSVNNGFNTGNNVSNMNNAIDTQITTLRTSTITYDSSVIIRFEFELSSSDASLLYNIVSSFDTIVIREKIRNKVYSPIIRQTNKKIYETVAIIKIDGLDKMKSIDYIEILANAHENTTSYSARVVDITNVKIICERTNITNKELEEVDLGTLSNLPKGEAVFELQMKIDDGHHAHIELIEVYYGNNPL